MAAHCHNSTGLPDEALSAPKPVNVWENETVNGMALCLDFVHQKETAKIDAYRAQQAEYLKSLPTKPEECLTAALRVLHQGGENHPEGFEEALYLSVALAPLLRSIQTDGPGLERTALLYIADRIRLSLFRLMPKLDEVADILGNPARLERDAKIFAAFHSDLDRSSETFRGCD